MEDDNYDDDELRVPDDDYTENDEVSNLTDLEVGGVVMADFGLDIGDDFDSEPSGRASSRSRTGKKAASVRRTRKPKVAGWAGKPAKKASKKKTAGRVKKKTVMKAARKSTKRKSTKQTAKKTALKTRRAATKRAGAAKTTRRVVKKK
jgi:hypothetical protein